MTEKIEVHKSEIEDVILDSSITQEDLWQYDEDLLVEVEDGEIKVSERSMTILHLLVIQNLYDLTRPFVRANHLGWVFTDGIRYILIGSRKKIIGARLPDFSFIRAGRIPQQYDWNGDFEGAPNLAVEVASPGQDNPYFMRCVGEYLSAGSEEVWIVYPARHEIIQYRRDDDMPRVYRAGDVLAVSGLFPGLELTIEALFVTSDE